MKKLLKLFVLLLCVFNIYSVHATFWDDLFDTQSISVDIDCDGGNCSLEKGVDLAKGKVSDIEKNEKFSDYVQDIVFNIIQFVSFIALVFIIFAGFKILTSGGDEEENKKAKGIIKTVIIGILLIWLAYPITIFIIDVLQS